MSTPLSELIRRPLAAALVAFAAAAAPAATPGADAAKGEDSGDATRTVVTREGVTVEIAVRPAKGDSDTVVAADWADVSFRITDATTGEPIKGRYPAAWMDLGAAWEAKGERPMSCRDRIQTYLQGIVGVRPMIDLNSHFLLVMNRDPSISVIDPVVGITGITNLFGQINLESPGADWVISEDSKRLFVTMPEIDQLALVDTDSFDVVTNVPAGERPTRIEMQSDGRYLWVGNSTRKEGLSGVTVLDAAELKQVAYIPTGAGHHEIAFTEDDRLAFVSNRDEGTVTVIDVQKLQAVKHIATGEKPLSLAYSALARALYVADGKDGRITVVDPETLEIRGRIDAEPGLGPMRFSQDGRWGVVVNPITDKVFVVDASDQSLAHTFDVGKQPYQVAFTRNFAYIRSLGTQDVGLIPVAELDSDTPPPVTYVPAGQNPPGVAADLSIADSMVPAVKQGAAAYIVNQAEGTVSYYMEGMAAPMGNFRNYGHEARAIEIVDRSLAESEPGVYKGRVKIPVEGSYDVAFMMDTPQFLHCFSADVEPNPDVKSVTAKMSIEYEIPERFVAAGETVALKFRLTDPATGLPATEIPDLSVLYYRSDGRDRTVVPAKPLGDGRYEADVKVASMSTYYVFVGSESREMRYTDLPFASLVGLSAKVMEARRAASAAAKAAK